MKCKEIYETLLKQMPLEYACDCDNPGFLVGRSDSDIKKIVTALDATDEVIDMAIEIGAQLIVSHHPLLFHPAKNVTDDTLVGRRILRLARHNICLICMHTNYDVAPGCMADIAAKKLGITKAEPLEITQYLGKKPIGIGKIGILSKAYKLDEFLGHVKSAFGLPFVEVYGKVQSIKRVAICPGSGSGMLEHCKEKKADVFIAGDISHHEGIDGAAYGICVINAGHYGTEHLFIKDMADRLRKIGKLEVAEFPITFPSVIS